MSSYIESKASDTGEEQLVCVTGAGGFIGSWVVKVLLLRGYHVRGTVRDPAADKTAHLLALEGAGERLTLCRTDLLDCNGLRAAFSGCHGVFHVASPVSNDPNLYCIAKMMAEITVTEEAAKRGLELAVVLPSMTIGPTLSKTTLSLSVIHVLGYLMGAKASYPNAVAAYTDVRDVALAHVLVYEHRDARGRYLCVGDVLHRAQLVQHLRDLFPQYPVAAKCEHDGKPMAKPYRFSTQRLKDLGVAFTPLRESLYETVVSVQKKGHLPLHAPVPKRASL